MKRAKKIIVLVMACVMMFGATLTVNAASRSWTLITMHNFCVDCDHFCAFYVNQENMEYKCGHGHIS